MSVWKEDELTCKPIDSYGDIELFLQHPPSWRTLCRELEPHSKFLLKNCNFTKRYSPTFSEYGPDTFCHFDPDKEKDVKRHEEGRLPKTLVCHDMANGYHDDSIIDGTGRYDAYTFYNWAGIDIFCYFSHHLITIPPLGWINVGHAHGVKVIGTVITEWAEGIAFWDNVLQSEFEYKNFASALVAIAKTLKFDGWLLNVENKISKPDTLLEFVKHLHKTLHQELKNPVLIWYDSVTSDGALNWQNALNHRNKAFFDACDGLFTNYSWTEELVIQSAAAAGPRLTDLYIGIDVWGRNFYGGGQFNVHKAVDVAFSHGCSLAIFAPAWTHEAMTMDKSDVNAVVGAQGLNQYDHFLLRDRALWDSLWRYLNTRVPSKLPFKTSFCRGQGTKRRLYGEVLCPVPWYNLRHMQYQPNSSHGPHGYILSTVDNILEISQKAAEKDKKGLIKYKEAIQATRHELNDASVNKIDFKLKIDSLGCLNDNKIEPDLATRDESVQSESYSVKRKMKNIIKHIFKVKSLRKEGDDNATQSYTEDRFDSRNKIEGENDAIQQPNADGVTHDERHDNSKKNDERDDSGPSSDTELNKNLQSSDVKDETCTSRVLAVRSMVQVSVNINLSQTEKIAKTRFILACVPDERQCLQVFFEDSFIGGSCLKIHSSDKLVAEHRFIRLFHCDFTCEYTLVFCVVTKNVFGSEEQYLNIRLFLEDANKQHTQFTLVGRNSSYGYLKEVATSNVYPMNNKTDSGFRNLQKYLLLYEPGFYVPVENSYNWTVRYYQVLLAGARLTSIACSTGLPQGPILLGHLGVCQAARIYEDTDFD